LVGEVLAEGESGPADGAKHVSAVGDFADTHLLAEADITELATGRAINGPDLEITTRGSLTESQRGVTFEI